MDRLAGGYGRRQYAASAEELEKGVVSIYLAWDLLRFVDWGEKIY